MFYRIDDRTPEKKEGVFVAGNATVIGSCVLCEESSIWFNAVLRGDNDVITVGPQSNVQDGAVLHTDSGIPLTLGKGVTVGHNAMLHGCDIGDYSLIGIGAVILNKARIGKHCIIGANALVPEGMDIPDGSLVVGSPAVIKRELNDMQKKLLEASAAHYVQNAERYTNTLEEVDL
ncbi:MULTISPECIES: gamma carbonic anhydrase family protein [Thalassolituus]|jgi:carbonic anhydrase/acetyltransferase-like protein (isoleucine patch superfamily)|uniref:gamma carbonic anhydrase family protein n=1 Tax=Thalassolituus TaxID=187492 RepID=UPI0007D00DF7|nr:MULTISPECIES: gamma carbonic anhydrase family protein [Thalassolituus]KZY99231.1 gamma carbonic anhydrase family protein [Oleibacter sp. HI0075]MAX85825.1 gamma carbonic anhydrase family protein [Oceanospirillaceae bacterium]MEE3161237.1 gamma carbonic anhydrase family protein [Pseudomonadota bacterium]HCG78894.1 gamma carbonic anhydrase family protein [Oceanospirillales bacterium]KZZ02364.1 gamma carbonic anhydrase family protein [Oleibacter sp. HI0075]|tara:strand:- start:559 stop:1083 length:525 start_codon:yes stop_codon:yes gene_type:complete